MMKRFTQDAARIFLACGSTDFRKQIPGLAVMMQMQFRLDPYDTQYVFIFCNKKKDGIKVLRYDRNGFVLATKKLLDGMKSAGRKHRRKWGEFHPGRWNGSCRGWKLSRKKRIMK